MNETASQSILIISIDQEFIAKLSPALTDASYGVLLAHDEITLTEVFSRTLPTLIVVDVGMGQVENTALLGAIRAQEDARIAQIPAIAASQTGDLVEIAAVLKLGVKDYFIKSNLNAPEVIQKIQKQVPPITVAGTSGGGMAPVSPSAGVPQAPSTPSVTKLLIVEDDKFLRDLAVQKISKEGFLVIAAVDGEQGVMLAEKEIPNIMLLDILLPGIDGFEVLRRVRANPALSATKIAMLSNFGQREDIEKALKAGADQFMVKANYTLDEIVEEVKKIVATPRQTT